MIQPSTCSLNTPSFSQKGPTWSNTAFWGHLQQTPPWFYGIPHPYQHPATLDMFSSRLKDLTPRNRIMDIGVLTCTRCPCVSVTSLRPLTFFPPINTFIFRLAHSFNALWINQTVTRIRVSSHSYAAPFFYHQIAHHVSPNSLLRQSKLSNKRDNPLAKTPLAPRLNDIKNSIDKLPWAVFAALAIITQMIFDQIPLCVCDIAWIVHISSYPTFLSNLP